MKNYQTDHIRNIALLGNSKSGKTTLAESMLLNGGLIERRGTVETRNTVSDYKPIEQENGNSIFSTVLYTEFQNHKINMLDTPGLDDFSGGVISSLHAADSAVILIGSHNGVEVGTEIHFRHADRAHKPVIFAANSLDHEKSHFDKTVEMLKERFGNNVCLVQFPVAEGTGFNAVIDVMKMKMLRFPKEGGKSEAVEIPAEHKGKAEELHNALVEKAAESEEKLMELFFENESLTEDQIIEGLVKGVATRGIFPVLCVSARLNYGVDRLMEFITLAAPKVTNMPAPVNSKGQEVKPLGSGPVSVFI
ncbi:MAG: GTP-binding protein, partial [Bacteroidetes bacterium]|nr:GTP-binding protein [Bacteroidota bacterium]